MTHDELTTKAEKWLRSRRCHVVLSNVRTTMLSEQPDVIGWRSHGFSELVEVKASRADFRRDHLKVQRRHPERGMGKWRWYFTTSGTIPLEEVLVGWGHVIVDARGKVSVLRPSATFEEFDRGSEKILLITALRRATEGWGRQMFGDLAPAAPDGDLHPSARKKMLEVYAENSRLREENARLQSLLRRAVSP